VEGWADLFSCVVRNEEVIQDWVTAFSGYTTYNLETGWVYYANGTSANANALGEDCEGSVAGLLWDIYDSVDDDQDGDGIGDYLSDGIYNIWDVFSNYEIDSHGCYDIIDFYDGWVDIVTQNIMEIEDIYEEHGIPDPSCPINPNSQIMLANKLINNYPNPFTLATVISYSLAHKFKNPRIEIYNVRGQNMKTFMLEEKKGKNSIMWDGKDEAGKYVSSGIYFQKLVNNNKVIDVKKMLLIK